MQFPHVSFRQRILAACLVISLAAVAAMTVLGLSFRSVLHARARENCTRVAVIFAQRAHDRLVNLAGATAALAKALARPSKAATMHQYAVLPAMDGKAALCSWAVYDADGHKLAGQRSPRWDKALVAAGIGTPRIVPRERERLAQAIAGHPSTVLVPDGNKTYALVYRPITRPGKPTQVLQAAGEAAGAAFPNYASEDDARAILRPFIASADTPHLVTVGGKPRLIVHRPLLFGGRQLGTVAAAVPYDAEARCEQGATLAVVAIAISSMLILAILSHLLTDVAMVPIERVRQFVREHQCGTNLSKTSNYSEDAVTTLLDAYQEILDQSQEFADRLVETNRALRDLLTGSVGALVSTMEAKDGYTAGHSQRVADTACTIAREMGWHHADVEQLRLGALLHDIGKVGISQAILNKPGSLTPEEREVVCQHPLIGARILSSLPDCEDIVRIILHHHERYDGAGYPSGTQGDEIPAAARIVAIADVYDALTSQRSYRAAYSRGEAVAILEESSGSSLDPTMLDAFLKLLSRTGNTDETMYNPAVTPPHEDIACEEQETVTAFAKESA